MDGQRFDEFTKRLGSGATRRSVVKALAGGIGGGLVAVVGRRAGGASATVACAVQDDACVDNAQAGVALPCCEGFICFEGFCDAVCATEGEQCINDNSCCDDLVCQGDSKGGAVCVAPACAAEGEECGSDEDCCAGICCAGACRAIECCIDEEDPNARCPEGTSCFEGQCDPVCSVEGGTCAADADCCEGFVCDKLGMCQVACMGEGDMCADDEDCCGDLLCSKLGTCEGDDSGGTDGGGTDSGGTDSGSTDSGSTSSSGTTTTTTTTTLPTTGIADGDGRANPLLGAGLAAGAAALLAAKKLRTDAATDPVD